MAKTPALKPEFVTKMKKALLEEKTKLAAELHRLKEDEPTLVDQEQGASEDENAAGVANLGDNLALKNELDKALKDTIKSLKSIEAGTYGTCKYCKDLIDERRLSARPTSNSCIKCKKLLTQEA